MHAYTVVVLVAASGALADELSNNLSHPSAGIETATTSQRLSASFDAGALDHVLSSVTLRLANPEIGEAVLTIHADAGLEPGAQLATLTPPNDYTNDLSDVTFTDSGGLMLDGGETYWLVLAPTSGVFEWSWSDQNVGEGEGFNGQWGLALPDEDDLAFYWWTQDIYPLQMRVDVDVASCLADFNGDGRAQRPRFRGLPRRVRRGRQDRGHQRRRRAEHPRLRGVPDALPGRVPLSPACGH